MYDRAEMNEELRVHGLDGTMVQPDWPPLTLAELRSLIAGFHQLGEPTEIIFSSPRPLSAAGIVKCGSRDLFVKRHARAVRDRQGLLEEHRFIKHLRGRGAAVPAVFENASGESAIEIDGWTYEVHEVAAGVDLYGDAISWTPFSCSAHAYEAGKALAQMHSAASGFDAPRRNVQPLVASFTIFAEQHADVALSNYLKARPNLRQMEEVLRCGEEALSLLASYHAELLPLLPHLAPLWTHNDLHASNLVWSGRGHDARSTAIIDFGLADLTNPVHDLANAIERNIVEWLVLVQSPEAPNEVPVHFDHLEALLSGYDSVRTLSREEAMALAPMTTLCHAEFALSEADYFLGVLRSEEAARMAYEGYLVGHARWFGSKKGRQLMDWLRRWADARRDDGEQHR
jgi:Ser/Thr protein kinase RdoA (MazF antagonist)